MKIDVTYWADEFGGRAEHMEIDLKPFGYKMAPVTEWEMLIAEENTNVEKGRPVVLKIKPVYISENTMVGPLSIMRHALGIVLNVVECGIPGKVEEVYSSRKWRNQERGSCRCSKSFLHTNRTINSHSWSESTESWC